MQIRQGDVLLEIDEKELEKGEKLPYEKGHAIVAHGEATGHFHGVLEKDAALYEAPPEVKNVDKILEITSPEGKLKHKGEDHISVVLAPSSANFTQQRQYQQQEIRRVTD